VGTQAQITSLAAGLPGALPARPDPLSGDLIQSERVIPPAVRRVPASMEMKDLPTDQSESYLAAGQGDLRMAAAAFCAPEFWMAETSSGNYSNLESAAAPAVRDGQCEQIYFQSAFAACVWRAVRWAQQCGRLPPGLEDLIKLDIESPAVRHRNELEKAQEDQIGVMNGWKDRQTASEERGLEWELVRRRNDEHDARELKKQALQQKVLGGPQQPPPGGGPPHPPGGGGPRPPSGNPPEPRPPRVTGGQVRESAEGDEEAPDPEEVAPLIAEVLYHLFGDDALDQLGSLQEAWAASDHPRGEGGRFIARGSAEAVSKAQGAVDAVLKGKGGDAREIANHLAILSVKQLRQLHQKNGVKKIPSAILRQHLVDAVVDKLTTTNELHALRKEFTGLKGARPPDTMGAAALKKQIAMAKEKPAPKEKPAEAPPERPAEGPGAAELHPLSLKPELIDGRPRTPLDAAKVDFLNAHDQEQAILQQMASPSLQLIKDTNVGKNRLADLQRGLDRTQRNKKQAEAKVRRLRGEEKPPPREERPPREEKPAAGGPAAPAGAAKEPRDMSDEELTGHVDDLRKRIDAARAAKDADTALDLHSTLFDATHEQNRREAKAARKAAPKKAPAPPEPVPLGQQMREEPHRFTRGQMQGEMYRLQQRGITPSVALQRAADLFNHRRSVEDALAAGKPVPPEVLADYPDLVPREERPAAGGKNG
jgi:hypothetical protein